MKIRPAAALLFSLALPLSAQADVLTMIASTPRLDYYAAPGVKVDVKKTEKYLAGLEEKFGARLDRRARFVRYRSEGELTQATGYKAVGITLPGDRVVHSALPFHAHELVHLMSTELGDPGVVLHEGLAVVVGDGGRVAARHIRDLRPSELRGVTFEGLTRSFQRGAAGDRGFLLAASFVKFLQDEHGLEALSALFRDCRRPQDLDRAMQGRFGRSLSQAWTAWQAQAVQSARN